MGELSTVVSLMKDIGIPALVMAGLFYVFWKISTNVPEWITKYVESAVARDKHQEQLLAAQSKKYDENMALIVTVAQQGLEAQKRGNEIIERNNLIMEAKTRMDEALIHTLDTLIEQSKRVEDVACGNRACVEKTYTEVVRVGERIR